ncbi:unnamed protein product, partial [marine sediment metagenome]
MPSITVNMDPSTAVIAAEKKNAKIIPTLLVVDNVEADQDAVLTLVDRFWPSASHKEDDPEVQTPTRLAINVSEDACISLDEDDLKGIEFLGAPEVVVVTTESDCKVTMGYKF